MQISHILRKDGKMQEDVESSTLVLLSITLIESNRRKAVIQIAPFKAQGYASYFYGNTCLKRGN